MKISVSSYYSELMNSIICAHNLKEVCADTEHSDIEVVMGDIVSMYELCHQRNYLEGERLVYDDIIYHQSTNEPCSCNDIVSQSEPQVHTL